MWSERVEFVFWILGKLVPVVHWWRAPLRAEVTEFRYEEMRNEPGDAVWVIRAHARAYSVTLELTNRSERRVYIKSFSLRITGECIDRDGDPGRSIQLEPGEHRESTVLFPLNSGEMPTQSGRFRLEVTPAVGRKTKICGSFPVRK